MAKRAGEYVALLLAALLVPLLLAFGASAQTTATSSLLVKLVPGMTLQEEANVIARNGGVEVSSIPALHLHVVVVPAGDVAVITASYQADPQVQHVEPNKTRVSESIPSDPLYAGQWYLPRIGWDQVFGSVMPGGSAQVALLDTGVDASHPELAGKVVPGTSILDGSSGMTDPSGHGTWLAGIIAARTDTGPVEGVAAVAYAGVQIMPVTVLDPNGEGLDSDVIAGVIWAADHGADVIVMAFSNPGFSPSLQDAIDYAWSKGAVLVAAAGNNASSGPTFPAGDRGVMGVAATDTTDALAYFSNVGEAVFIAAPGTDIQTIDIGGAYTVVSGTSTSAAIVAGAAALMKAVDPTLTNGVIVGRLARNADPAGLQTETGNGRINLARALADTSTESVQPAGADPVGAGGPFVGPYRAAARSIRITFAGTGGGQAQIGATSGAVTFATTGGNRCDTPPASGTGAGTLLVTINGTCTTLSSSDNGATVTVTAVQNGTSFFAGWSSPNGGFTACTLTSATCSAVLGGGQNDLTVTFSTRVNTTTVASSATATFGDASVTLNATVTPASGSPVGEGTVTFTVKKGATLIGTVTSGTISAGNASAVFPLAAVNADTYTLETTYNPAAANPRFNTSNGAVRTLTVTRAASTTAAANKAATFSIADQTVALTATVTSGAGSVSQGTVTFTVKDGATVVGTAAPGSVTGGSASASYTLPGGSAAKTYTIEAAYTSGATGNFADSADNTRTLTVSKAATTTTAANATATFSSTDQAVMLTASVTSGAGSVNQGSVTFTVKDGASIVGSPASGTVTSGNAAATFTLPGGSAARTYTIEAAYTSGPTGNFGDSSDNTRTLTVNKAATTTTAADETTTFSPADQVVTLTATVTSGVGTVNQGSVTFTVKDGTTVVGSAPSASVVSGNASASYTLPGGSVAKTYTITAAYTSGPTGNFADSSDATRTLKVNSAPVTVTITGGPFTYDGQPHAATVASTPSTVGYSVTYTGTTTAYSSAAPPTNADTYTVTVTITDPNYVLSGPGTGNITIDRANPIVTATGNTCTYNGLPCAGSGSAVGVLGEALTPVTVAYTTTPVPGNLLTSAPVNAGTYLVAARYAGDANYNPRQSAPATLIINKATPTVSVTGGTFSYDGAAHAASGFAYGVGGVGDVLTPPVTVSYVGTGSTVYGPSATAPTNAGFYEATAGFAGNANYTSASSTAAVTINKANPIVTATGNTCTYTGAPCAGSASAVGVLGEALTPVNIAYKDSLGSLLSSAPVSAGTYSVAARYAGDANYNAMQSTADTITINKATPGVSVTGGTFTYDGAPHGATGFAYGVGGVGDVLSPDVTVSYTGTGSTVYGPSATAPTSAGTYQATAGFAGNANYTSASSTAAVTINKANPIVTAAGNTCTYNGLPCAGSGSAVGVLGEPLTPVTVAYTTTPAPGNLLTSPPVNAGTYLVAARYAGDANYAQMQSATPAVITIDRATPTLGLTGGSFTYDGTPHAASGFAYGVGGVGDVLTPAMTFGYVGTGSTVYGPSATAPTNAGFYEASASFAGNANYTSASDTTAITISPATTNTTIVAPTITNNTTLTITVNVTSAGGTPGGGVDLTLDGGPSSPVLTLATTPLTNGSASFIVPGLSDGSYLLAATYTAGGNFLPSNGAWTTVIDTAAPDTVIDSGPAGLTTLTTAPFTYHGSDSSGDTFRCSLDGGPWTDCNGPAPVPGLHAVTYTGLLPGPHSFQVRGADLAGNADASPASRSWIIGSVTNDLDTVDESFRHVDGFDVVFGKGTGTSLKITSTNPGTLHHQLFITNNTGVGLNTPGGQTAYTSAIIEVPGMPASCGPNIACSPQIDPVRDPAFRVRGHSAAHVWPDNHEEQLAITVQYMTLAAYQQNGNSCADVPGASYSSTLPADGAPKCIKVSGYALPHKHKARIRTNFEFRPRGTDLWDPNSKLYFFAGFAFKSATTVTYGGASQTSIDAAGIVGAGNKMTAVGGFVFDPYGAPGTGQTVRLFDSLAAASATSCASSANVVAQDVVDATGFYFIWRTGMLNDTQGQQNLLPSGVQYAVQLCNGTAQLGPIKTTDNKLHNQEFEQVDFDGVAF
jgi:subtilisin family serine protease